MITTTLNAIREEGPCAHGWTKLLKHLGKTERDNEVLPFVTILDSNGLDDALWCTRAAPEHNRLWRLYAVWCARQVQHLLTDPCSLATLDIAERHAHGLATDEELAAAEHAAWVAIWDARAIARSAAANAARNAVWDAAMAAAANAARNAAANAAGAAAWDAVWAAASAAARAAASAAAYAAARDAQTAEFRRIVMETAA